MDEKIKKIAAKLLDFWKSVSKKKKILMIGGFSGILIIIVAMLVFFNTTRYTLLYSGLSDSDAGQIVTQLKTLSVPYKVSGNDIYVDKNQADEARMQLAENGYPSSTLTYSTYSSGTSWAMTDSDKERYALYQVQDRLQATIRTIPGVKSVEVTIAPNSDTDYVLSSDQTPVTASVKLSLNAGISLSKKQVQGIVLLISHSYPNLSKDNVTVLDSDGTPLTGSSSTSGDSTEQLQLQNQVESEVKSKVLAVLKPVYGENNIQVAAGAVLDFSEKTTNKTTYSGSNNGKGIVSSEQNTTSTSGGSSSTASGTAGVNGGTPTYPSTTSSGTQSGNAQSSTTTNYLVNSVNEQIKDSGGSVSKLTIAVMLNSQSQAAATANAAGVKETVAYAVGIDPANISVQEVPFSTSQSSNNAAAAGKINYTYLAVAAGAALLLIIAVSLLITMMLSHKRKKKRLAAEQLAEQAAEQQAEKPADPKTVAPPVHRKSIQESLENSEKDSVKTQIEDFADEKPELVAQILRNWLKE